MPGWAVGPSLSLGANLRGRKAPASTNHQPLLPMLLLLLVLLLHTLAEREAVKELKPPS